jgi:TetR/AcrR family transcriptional regulator, regulator of biofilm formation and stress response
VRASTADRPARRHDPDRHDRIVEATIGVIAEHGVAGTTHRLIAAAADVPLGSLTYHFTGLGDLLAQAFTRHAERMAAGYEARFAEVEGTPDVVDAVVDAVTELVHGDAGADDRDWAVAYELYLAALRDPALRTVTESWMRRSRGVLERFVDPTTASGLDALVEGLVMHKVLSTGPVSREQTREIVARAVRPTAGAGR